VPLNMLLPRAGAVVCSTDTPSSDKLVSVQFVSLWILDC
jgi:hypothetical protein